MQNPRIAARYAKSLIDLAIEQNNLEDTLQDVQLLNSVCSKSKEFCVMLRSPVINADKKVAVINAVMGDKLHTLTKAFANLLVNKHREGALPEIAKEFIVQYNKLKNISLVKLTSATAIDDSLMNAIKAKIAESLPGQSVEMEVKIDPELIGGFMLEMGDKLVDASVRRDLAEVKKQFMDKSYTLQIR